MSAPTLAGVQHEGVAQQRAGEAQGALAAEQFAARGQGEKPFLPWCEAMDVR